MLKVLFFGSLGEMAADEVIRVDPSTAGSTPEALRQYLEQSQPQLAAALCQPQVLVAVNQQSAHWQTPLADGDEVAFMPPVTGG